MTTHDEDKAVHENLRAAEGAVAAVGGIPERQLSDSELADLSDAVLVFCQQMTGITLHSYEKEFAWRIIFSLLSEDAEEITALFSRQSGKTETVAVVVCGCMVLLPILANAIKADSRISKFKDGLWCGIYAPNYRQAGIMWSRMKARMYSKESRLTMLDPDINIDLDRERQNMALPNGSFCDCSTASVQSKIEGMTYHLILLEETQDIDSGMIRASIHPMGAATAASMVKVGTCNRVRSDFYEACRRNKRSDVAKGLIRSNKRLHFEFDYTVVLKFNPRYAKYVQKEIVRLGEDSDDFRMKYRLHWLLERGMFVNPDLFDECGIKDSDSNLIGERGKGKAKKKVLFTRAPNVVTYDPTTPELVFAIDVGRENSTVVTVGKVFWECPQSFGDEERYPIHIYNWLELEGDDHESQHPQIVEFLKNYHVSMGIVDATGKGDPIYSRLASELEKYGITVVPFVFSSTSKDVGYKTLLQEIKMRRITFPAGSRASRLLKWQKFVNQMYDLEKEWRGQTMVVHKPKTESDARDDYPDSLMMLCYLVNVEQTQEAEQGINPFVGRASRWGAASVLKEAGAWYRGLLPGSRERPARPNKRGMWGGTP